MKNLIKIITICVFVAFLYVGCGKQPTQQMNDAKAAIEAAVKEGADIYGKEELKRLNDDLAAVEDEINVQSKKFFKNYKNAEQMLAKIKTEAEALKATIPARKEEAKNNATTAQNEALSAVEEAKNFLGQAPKGKGTRADIEAFKADLKGLEDSLKEVQQAIDKEDYLSAADTARSIKEKAIAISDQIKQAIEKVKTKK